MKTPKEWAEWQDQVFETEHRHVTWVELVGAIQADAIEAAASRVDRVQRDVSGPLDEAWSDALEWSAKVIRTLKPQEKP